jgi:hypothetical protein
MDEQIMKILSNEETAAERERKEAEARIIARVEEMVSFLRHLGGEKALEADDRIAAQAKILRREVPDYRQYYLFHVMGSSSGVDRRKCKPELDMPGEYSIVAFLEGLCAEYGEKRKDDEISTAA